MRTEGSFAHDQAHRTIDTCIVAEDGGHDGGLTAGLEGIDLEVLPQRGKQHITGSADYAADGQCVLTNLERATETKMGDQVITTGLGGVFPPDLLVGTVQDVVPETSGKSSIAVVRPGADPRTAKHVFIVTAY